MPLYDFRCQNGHTFVTRIPMDSITTARPECPECGMESVRVFLEVPGVLMRPAGYSTMPGDKNYSTIPTERHPHIKSRYREIQSWQFNSKKAI